MFELIVTVVEGAALVVAGASVLAAVLPVPESSKTVLGKLRKILDALAANLANAANSKKPKDD